LSLEAVHAQLASAFTVVLHLGRHGHRRVLREVGVLSRGPDGSRVVVRPALRWSGEMLVRDVAWTDLAALLERDR